jgi:hypothetical protein
MCSLDYNELAKLIGEILDDMLIQENDKTESILDAVMMALMNA